MGHTEYLGRGGSWPSDIKSITLAAGWRTQCRGAEEEGERLVRRLLQYSRGEIWWLGVDGETEFHVGCGKMRQGDSNGLTSATRRIELPFTEMACSPGVGNQMFALRYGKFDAY